jgi:hypothetical protein
MNKPHKRPNRKKTRTCRNMGMALTTPAYLQYLGCGSESAGLDLMIAHAVGGHLSPPMPSPDFPNPFCGEKND